MNANTYLYCNVYLLYLPLCNNGANSTSNAEK